MILDHIEHVILARRAQPHTLHRHKLIEVLLLVEGEYAQYHLTHHINRDVVESLTHQTLILTIFGFVEHSTLPIIGVLIHRHIMVDGKCLPQRLYQRLTVIEGTQLHHQLVQPTHGHLLSTQLRQLPLLQVALQTLQQQHQMTHSLNHTLHWQASERLAGDISLACEEELGHHVALRVSE